MKVLIIMWKEIMQNLRNRRAMIMMVLFPIVLILVLGSALSKAFSDDGGYTVNAEVIYSMDNNTVLNSAFTQFINSEALKNLKITFDKTDDINKGIDSIKDSKYTCYVRVTDKDIKIYKNDRFADNAAFVEGILGNFVDRLNVIGEVAKVNPAAVPGLLKDTEMNYTKTVALQGQRTPRAKDYYAITMITLIILYGTSTGFYAINREKMTKTQNRLLSTPVKKTELFLGKTLGSVITVTFQIAIVVLISKYVLNTYWGDNIWTVLLIIFSEICAAVSIGIAVALLVKKQTTGNGILNAIIPFMAFLGGNYFPIENIGSKAMTYLSNISPLKWTNQSIFKVIYGNDFTLVATALLVNIGIVIVLLSLASIQFRKEAI